MALLIRLFATVGLHPDNCDQYFDGLNVLIKSDKFTKDSENLLQQVLTIIQQHPVVEVF